MDRINTMKYGCQLPPSRPTERPAVKMKADTKTKISARMMNIIFFFIASRLKMFSISHNVADMRSFYDRRE